LWLLPIYTDGIAEVMEKNGSIDGSMKIGLNWADVMGLKFGKDIIFTYGPLYILANNAILSFNKTGIIFANIFNILLWFMVLFLLSWNISNRLDFSEKKSSLMGHIVIISAIVAILNIFIGLSEMILLLSFLLIFTVLENNLSFKHNLFWLSLSGLLLSLISLIKFVYFVVAFTFIFIAIIVFIIIKKFWNIAALLLSYLLFLIIFWLVLEKSFLSIFPYLKNSLLITFGYSENVQLFANGWEAKFNIFYVILIFLIWIGVLIFGIVKKNKRIIYYFILSLPVIFLIYKQGFMRQDYFHTQEYFRFIIYLLIMTIAVFGTSLRKMSFIFLILIIFALPFKSAYDTLEIREQIAKNSRELKAIVKIFSPVNHNILQLKLEDDKKEIKADYPVGSNIISKIHPDDSVDIFTWEIFQVFVNDLDWSPRPVFQSYNAYNPYLDNLNAAHFSNLEGPDKVIYKVAGIEDRYAIFDEPLVFQELLKNYDFIDFDENGYSLLSKRQQKMEVDVEELSDVNCKIGQKIDLPKLLDGYIFAKINIDLNIAGKLKNIMYKGDYIYIKFYFEDKNIDPIIKRFVRENAINGLYLSSYIENEQDLKNVFENKKNQNNLEKKIKGIEIFTMNNKFYYSEFTLKLNEYKFR